MSSAKSHGGNREEFRTLDRHPCYLFSNQGRILSVPKRAQRDLIKTDNGSFRLRIGSRKDKSPRTTAVKITLRNGRYYFTMRADGRYRPFNAAELIAEAWTGHRPTNAFARIVDDSAEPLLAPSNLQWQTRPVAVGRRVYGEKWRQAVKEAGLKRRKVNYQHARALSADGMSDTEIAEALNTTAATINRIVGARRPRGRIDGNQVVKLWNDGISASNIATALQIGVPSVYRALHRQFGCIPQQPQRTRVSVEHQAILRLWGEGMRIVAIARAVKCGKSTVSRVVSRAALLNKPLALGSVG